MAGSYRSLYRRYRPARFGQLVGQEHVTAALTGAVKENKIGHAYLFSGPRGTGKTSTARILAKAANCETPDSGEPCERCYACEMFASGQSMDLFEMDAASRNKVEDVRELLSKIAYNTPGTKKVYVLDEAHMLTREAENALLKTLEEPPSHVIFIMCTTEPHKVADTVRSRAQRLEFHLLPERTLAEHVRWVAADAGLSLSDSDVLWAAKEGRGSVRDALSALDQAVSASAVPVGSDGAGDLVDALAAKDLGAAMKAVEVSVGSGGDPKVLVEQSVGFLRNVFLTQMGLKLDLLDDEREATDRRCGSMTPADTTRALEEFGEVLVRMRQSADTRIDLDLSIVKLLGETPQKTQPPAAATVASAAAPVPAARGTSAGQPKPTAAQPAASAPDPSAIATATQENKEEELARKAAEVGISVATLKRIEQVFPVTTAVPLMASRRKTRKTAVSAKPSATKPKTISPPASPPRKPTPPQPKPEQTAETQPQPENAAPPDTEPAAKTANVKIGEQESLF